MYSGFHFHSNMVFSVMEIYGFCRPIGCNNKPLDFTNHKVSHHGKRHILTNMKSTILLSTNAINTSSLSQSASKEQCL